MSLFRCDRERREQDRQAEHFLLWERQPRADPASRRAHDLLHVQLRPRCVFVTPRGSSSLHFRGKREKAIELKVLNINKGRCRYYYLTLFFVSFSIGPGYVQGMSDLLSPILFITQNEVESFWCLTGFMDLVVSRNLCFSGTITNPDEAALMCV